MFRSIKHKLISLFLIAVLTPLLVMRLIAYPSAQKAILETTISSLQSIGSQKVSQVTGWLNRLKSEAERTAHNPLAVHAVHGTNTDTDAISYVLSHTPCEPGFDKYMMCDVSGNVKVSTDTKMIGLNVAGIEGFSHAIEGKTYVSDIQSSVFYDADNFGNRSERLPVMYIAVPLRKEGGNVAGVMLFQVDLSVLTKEVQERHYGNSYDVYVINQHGLMITESIFTDQLQQSGLITQRTTLELAVVEPQTRQFTRSVRSCLKGSNGFDMNGYRNYAGEKVVGVWFWMPELKWGIITEIRANEVSFAMDKLRDPILAVLSYLTIAGVVLAIAGIAFSLVIGQKIANPIMELTTATRKMSAGDLSQRVTIKTQDEVRELGDSFNVMAESVQEKTTKLQETSNFLNSILVSSTEHSIIAADLDGNILAFNEGAKRMFGYEPEELIQRSGIHLLYPKADVESGKIKKLLETTRITGRYKNEMQLLRKNGEVFTGYSTFTTRQSSHGRPIGFVMITRDITEQKLLEQELHNYTIQLEKRVEERTKKLRISEEKYRRLFETSKDVVFFCDTECQFIDMNQAGVDLFGYDSKSEILKLNLVQHLFFSPADGKAIKEMVCKNGFIKDYEVELKKRDGCRVPCLMTSNLRRDERNNIIGYEGIIIDLTERKR